MLFPTVYAPIIGHARLYSTSVLSINGGTVERIPFEDWPASYICHMRHVGQVRAYQVGAVSEIQVELGLAVIPSQGDAVKCHPDLHEVFYARISLGEKPQQTSEEVKCEGRERSGVGLVGILTEKTQVKQNSGKSKVARRRQFARTFLSLLVPSRCELSLRFDGGFCEPTRLWFRNGAKRWRGRERGCWLALRLHETRFRH